MNSVDSQYIEILKDIIYHGNYKQTRSGAVRSVFGRTMRFNLSDGIPLLTTKKVFVKGIIHELLWFLKGDTNIKYLVENNVHIWDDDAYRFYKETCYKNVSEPLDKENFLNLVLENTSVMFQNGERYTFGDLGDIYGKSWRNFGISGTDQIKGIVNALKKDPDNRRMLCVAYNPDVVDKSALPPCHVMFQFYTRKLSKIERLDWLCKHSEGNEYDEWKDPSSMKLDELGVPERELSCSFIMRSNDFCCGNPYNIAQYAMLTYMMAQCVNMTVGELVYFGGDVHVYENHVEAAMEQINRNGSEKIPKLVLNKEVKEIDGFKYEDFVIEGYEPDQPIKYQLNVG